MRQAKPKAKQATDYANWVFYKDNRGFAIMHDWFKDALLEKVGVVKAYWDDSVSVIKETYEGLSDDELVMLMSDQSQEIIAQETVSYQIFDPNGQPMIALS